MKNYLKDYDIFRREYINEIKKENNYNIDDLEDLNESYKFFTNIDNVKLLNELLDYDNNRLDLLLESEDIDEEDDLDFEDLSASINALMKIVEGANVSGNRLYENKNLYENLYEYEMLNEGVKDVIKKGKELLVKFVEKLKNVSPLKYSRKKKRFVGVSADMLNGIIYKQRKNEPLNLILGKPLKKYISEQAGINIKNPDFKDFIEKDKENRKLYERYNKTYSEYKRVFGDYFGDSSHKLLKENEDYFINEADDPKEEKSYKEKEDAFANIQHITAEELKSRLDLQIKTYLFTNNHINLFRKKYDNGKGIIKGRIPHRNKEGEIEYVEEPEQETKVYARRALEQQARKNRLSILVFGSPGCGKTDIINSIKSEYNRNNEEYSDAISFDIWMYPVTTVSKLDLAVPVHTTLEALNGKHFTQVTQVLNVIKSKSESELLKKDDEKEENTVEDSQAELMKGISDMSSKALSDEVIIQVPNMVLPLYDTSLGDMGNDATGFILYSDSAKLGDIYEIGFDNPQNPAAGLKPIVRKPDAFQYANNMGGGYIFLDEYLRADNDVKDSLMTLLAGDPIYNNKYATADRWLFVGATNTPYELSNEYKELAEMMDIANMSRWSMYYLDSLYSVWKKYIESKYGPENQAAKTLLDFMDEFITDENDFSKSGITGNKIPFINYNAATNTITSSRDYSKIIEGYNDVMIQILNTSRNCFDISIYDLELDDFLNFIRSFKSSYLVTSGSLKTNIADPFIQYLEASYSINQIFMDEEKKHKGKFAQTFYTKDYTKYTLDKLMENIKDIYSSAPDVEFDESSSIFIISTIVKIAATYKPCTKYWTKKGNESILDNDILLDDLTAKNFDNILTLEECQNINDWISSSEKLSAQKGQFTQHFRLAHYYLTKTNIELINSSKESGKNAKYKPLYDYLNELYDACKFLQF